MTLVIDVDMGARDTQDSSLNNWPLKKIRTHRIPSNGCEFRKWGEEREVLEGSCSPTNGRSSTPIASTIASSFGAKVPGLEVEYLA